MSGHFKVCLLPGCVLVRYLVLQYSGALPEADMSDLPGSPAPVHPHPGWCPAHPAHTAATLHRHAGEHPYEAGGMQFKSFFFFFYPYYKEIVMILLLYITSILLILVIFFFHY